MIECPNWSECGVPNGGCCAARRYGGNPSYGVCGVCLTIQRTEAEMASETNPGLFAKAVSFAKAQASALIAEVSESELRGRLGACSACEALKPLPVPQLGYCLACGCGENPLAELTAKARLPLATCPKGKWQAT